jgi:hypothetical protein
MADSTSPQSPKYTPGTVWRRNHLKANRNIKTEMTMAQFIFENVPVIKTKDDIERNGRES